MPVTAPSGYRKRRLRSTHQPHPYHQQHQQHIQQTHVRPPQQSREDIHDEMDILSVKQEVSKRFALNHSLMENVTSKFFAIDDIIPPRSFPEAVIQGTKYVSKDTEEEINNKELMEREELIMKSKLTNLLPNDITFGDLKLMKLQLKMLEDDVAVLERDENSGSPFGEEFQYQSKMIELMRKTFAELNDKESHAKNVELVEEIINKDYNGGKFQKKIKEIPKISIYEQKDLLPHRITAASMEEQRKKQEELMLRQVLSMQNSLPRTASHQIPQQPPSQPQSQPQSLAPPPMVPMSTQNAPYDIYNGPQSFIPNTVPTQHNSPPLPPPTFLSAQLPTSQRATPQPTHSIPQSSHPTPTQVQIHSQDSAPPQQLPSEHEQLQLSLSLEPQQHEEPQTQEEHIPRHEEQPPSSFENHDVLLDNFEIFSPGKDIFEENQADDILIDDATFNGLQSTLDDQIFFDNSME